MGDPKVLLAWMRKIHPALQEGFFIHAESDAVLARSCSLCDQLISCL
jgi:hypothetical protein